MAAPLAREVGNAQVLADLEEDARGGRHRLTGGLRDFGYGRCLAEHVEAGDVGGKVGRDAAFAEAARLALQVGLAARRQSAVERRRQRSEPGLVTGNRAGQVRERRAVAQEPLRLCIHQVLGGFIEAQLRLALHPAVERVDALPELRQIEHLARRHEGVRHVRRRAGAFRRRAAQPWPDRRGSRPRW